MCIFCKAVGVNGVPERWKLKENVTIERISKLQGQKWKSNWYIYFKSGKRSFDKVQIYYCPICGRELQKKEERQ